VRLLRRIMVENRIAVTLISASLLGTIVFYLGGVYPLERRVDQTRRFRSGISKTLDDTQNRSSWMRAGLEQERLATNDLDRFYDEILPENLSVARNIIYVGLAELAAKNGLVMERRNSQSVPGEFNGLVRLQANMLLAGQWRNVRNFIAAVENGPEFLVIADMVLSQREDMRMPLTLRIEVATYYRAVV